MSERLKDIAMRWMEGGWQQGNTMVIDELHAADFVDHDPGDCLSGTAGVKRGIKKLYEAFPDFCATVEELLIDQDSGKLAIRWSATGEHKGPFLGKEPTGRRIRFKGIEILHVKDDLIVERWGEWDGLGLLRQLS